MAVTQESVLFYMHQHKKPISAAELRDKLGLNPKYGMNSRFVDLGKEGLIKRHKNIGVSVPYTITAKGIAHYKANKHAVQSLAAVIEESNKAGTRAYNRSAPIIPMNAKANVAIDSISKLLDDYNRANQMLKIIHGQIGDYLNDNKLGESHDEQQRPDTEEDQSSSVRKYTPRVKRSSKRPAKRTGKKRPKKH